MNVKDFIFYLRHAILRYGDHVVKTDSTGSTRVRTAQARIWYLILRGEVRPGDPLRPGVLAKQLEVSPTVIREALSNLAAENLVQADPHRGYRVSQVSKEGLDDLTRVRIEVESLALRWSIQAGSIEWQGEVAGAFARYAATAERAVSDPDFVELVPRAHAQLHHAFVAACGSPRLLSIHGTLFDEAEMYRRWIHIRPDAERDPVQEHRAIADACTARDTDHAVQLIQTHIQFTADLVAVHSHLGESAPDGPDSANALI